MTTVVEIYRQNVLRNVVWLIYCPTTVGHEAIGARSGVLSTLTVVGIRGGCAVKRLREVWTSPSRVSFPSFVAVWLWCGRQVEYYSVRISPFVVRLGLHSRGCMYHA